MKNIEQELKMALDEREYNILLDVSGVSPQLQTNYYFSYKGMTRETMIRLRVKGDEYRLCYKYLLSHHNGVAVCDERDCKVPTDVAEKLLERGMTQDEAKRFFGVDVPGDLYLVGSMYTYLAKFQLQEWTLELDKCVYAGVEDYELECENLYVEQLEKLKNYLFYAYGIVFRQSAPKVQRFLQKFNK